MTLAEFIKTYVCENTLVRLWTETPDGHWMIFRDDSEVNMEWAILDGSGWGAEYRDWTVIGVTDILCASYPEAVNIVIMEG